jgi:hypothetical protein
MIYDVKHVVRHKAWLVAGGYFTNPNTESVYSGIVSLRGLLLIVFLAELNKLQLWGVDVGIAYLEATTKSKLYMTSVSDLGNLPDQGFDWCYTVYGNVHELIPTAAPEYLGNFVLTVTYTDANIYHDILNGRSVTGILHLCNQTLIDYYSWQQATVETATFGSEFTAARIVVDQKIV